ncbi:MAG: hypothetical protein VX293_03735, partial [Candidatus Latescibacterota bacterium]|nr:hypothetical protein [Candidatus Latescibacterota bacterium]
MHHLRNLALLVGILCFGLSPTMVASQELIQQPAIVEDYGLPSPPPELEKILEELLGEGDLSDAATIMLKRLLMTPEEREAAGEPETNDGDPDAIHEEEAAKEEIEAIFHALLEDD